MWRTLNIIPRYQELRREELFPPYWPISTFMSWMLRYYYENRDNPDRTAYGTMLIAFHNLLYPYRDVDKFF